MANTPVVVLDDTMTSIANAIRAKTGETATMTPGQMPAQIAAIPSGGGVGITREVSAQGVYQMPAQSFTFSLPANATDVGTRALSYAFRGCTALTSVDLSSLTTVSGDNALQYAFYECTALTSADLSSLTTVSGGNALNYAFGECTALASISFPSLATVSGGNAFNGAFSGCRSLTSISFPSLTTVSGSYAFYYAFYRCAHLANLSFPALTASSFGSYTDQFVSMLSGIYGCTVHFPAAIQAEVASLSGYPYFGGTNTTVLFDL